MGLLHGRSIRGIVQGDSVSSTFIPNMIEWWKQGRFPFEKLITYYDGLDQINQAVEDTHAGSVIKPVIRISKQ